MLYPTEVDSPIDEGEKAAEMKDVDVDERVSSRRPPVDEAEGNEMDEGLTSADRASADRTPRAPEMDDRNHPTRGSGRKRRRRPPNPDPNA